MPHEHQRDYAEETSFFKPFNETHPDVLTVLEHRLYPWGFYYGKPFGKLQGLGRGDGSGDMVQGISDFPACSNNDSIFGERSYIGSPLGDTCLMESEDSYGFGDYGTVNAITDGIGYATKDTQYNYEHSCWIGESTALVTGTVEQKF